MVFIKKHPQSLKNRFIFYILLLFLFTFTYLLLYKTFKNSLGKLNFEGFFLLPQSKQFLLCETRAGEFLLYFSLCLKKQT